MWIIFYPDLSYILIKKIFFLPFIRFRYMSAKVISMCRETKESLERTLAQLAEVQSSLEKQRQEQEEDLRREKEQEVKLMIDSVAAAELDNLR